jgi:hypothetical protein
MAFREFYGPAPTEGREKTKNYQQHRDNGDW